MEIQKKYFDRILFTLKSIPALNSLEEARVVILTEGRNLQLPLNIHCPTTQWLDIQGHILNTYKYLLTNTCGKEECGCECGHAVTKTTHEREICCESCEMDICMRNTLSDQNKLNVCIAHMRPRTYRVSFIYHSLITIDKKYRFVFCPRLSSSCQLEASTESCTACSHTNKIKGESQTNEEKNMTYFWQPKVAEYFWQFECDCGTRMEVFDKTFFGKCASCENKWKYL